MNEIKKDKSIRIQDYSYELPNYLKQELNEIDYSHNLPNYHVEVDDEKEREKSAIEREETRMLEENPAFIPYYTRSKPAPKTEENTGFLQPPKPLIEMIERSELNRAWGCSDCFKSASSANNWKHVPKDGLKHCVMCNTCMTWYSTNPTTVGKNTYYFCSQKCGDRFARAVVLN